jgi:transposase
LSEGDHAKIVERQVNALDQQVLDDLYRGSGSLAYAPVPLLKMVLYQYLKGNRSPARWQQEAELNEAMQWLGRGYVPARRTWYEFRDRVGDCIEQLHKQLIGRAMEQERLDPSVGVQDGTSVAACASRHRMVNEETLQKRLALLGTVITNSHDASEELPKWVPPTLSGQLDVAKRMKVAGEFLAERIARNAAKRSDKRKDPAKIVVSLTDPIAPLGRDKLKVYRPLYTVQYVIEPTSHLIMSYCCEAAVSDVGTLAPMIDRTQSIVGGRLMTMMADAAYCTILDLRDCEARNVELLAPVQANTFTEKKQQTRANKQIPRDAFAWDETERSYHCPEGHRLDYCGRERKQRYGGRTLFEFRYRCSPLHCKGCPRKSKCLGKGSAARMIKRLEGQELLDAQREKMAQADVQARYALRGQTVERGFADAKEHRRLDRFHGRGLRRAQTETGLLVLAQNLLRLDRLEQESLNQVEMAT